MKVTSVGNSFKHENCISAVTILKDESAEGNALPIYANSNGDFSGGIMTSKY